ncbi:MAG: hypothetical protein JWQ36_1089 [Enterovirga sp.]|jgi:hypothetical protein|nr:hypothetical protein [Enterovirga sp.]
MSAIIKRKLRQTWREAVAARLAQASPATLAQGLEGFDAAVAAGEGEAEAAFVTLSAHGLLWHVDGAGFAPSSPEPQDRHSVPSV